MFQSFEQPARNERAFTKNRLNGLKSAIRRVVDEPATSPSRLPAFFPPVSRKATTTVWPEKPPGSDAREKLTLVF